MAYWGYHAMFDCAACAKGLITSKDNVYNFIIQIDSLEAQLKKLYAIVDSLQSKLRPNFF